MQILDNQPVLDQFPADQATPGQAAILGPIINSNGGYCNIEDNPVYAEYAYTQDGSAAGIVWGDPVPLPVGPIILAPGTVGVRFRNYTPGQNAVVFGSLSFPREPQVQITSGGIATAGSSSEITGRLSSLGSIVSGTGFSVLHTGTGAYTVSFDSVQAAIPLVQVQWEAAGSTGSVVDNMFNPTTSGFQLQMNEVQPVVQAVDVPWNFTAQQPV